MRHPPHLLAAALTLLVVAGCGWGAPDRPNVIATFPVDGEVLTSPLGAVRVTYDVPVRILNPRELVVWQGWGPVPTVVARDPGDPNSILAWPAAGYAFLPGSSLLEVSPGLAVNADDQYSLNPVNVYFTVGAADRGFFAVPHAVVEVGLDLFDGRGTTATPGGREPLAVASVPDGAAGRVWVQLADDGGTGEALASFQPGNAVMEAVALTFEPGGGLSATAPALGTSPSGQEVYAAYRDVGLGRVRLARVTSPGGIETGSLVLSPPASEDPWPRGLSVTDEGDTVWVACSGGAGGRLVAVATTAFAEIDLGPDPGVDGLPLPLGAGPIALSRGLVVVAPETAASADLVAIDTDDLDVDAYASPTLGAPTALLSTWDQDWVLEGLAGYTGGAGLVVRAAGVLDDPQPLVVSDRTAGADPAATAVRALAGYPGTPRALVLLDDDSVAVFTWTSEWVQVDLDPDTVEIEAADLSTVAAGARAVAFPARAWPP